MAPASHFRKVVEFKADYAPSEFKFYESERTGMRVAVVDQKGPKVYGYFALATEIHDDSGAPHTLEHLVFMGSKSYKYKGILDKLATRAYSNTNAWTAVDHTAYTLETAGWDGFAQILPVYLEHVLVPTLTDAGCYTEVHHVDGQGNDAGVVYSEMQGTQNSAAELMELQARRILYPETVGFRYETGGLMEKLRVLTSNRIRDFHKEMYQPKNMCLVLIGEIDHTQLLEILDHFENGILQDVPRLDEPFTRPWQKHGRTPVLKGSTVQTVEFPEEDESIGELLVGFLGPDYDDDVASTAMNVFLVYLCGSSVSLLENIIVEKEQLASAVYYNSEVRPDMVVWFSLSGVATERLLEVKSRFFEVLEGGADKPLNMEYLQECVRRFRRQIVFAVEGSATTWSDVLIYDHLFGKRNAEEIKKLGTISELDEIERWSEEEWRAFYKRWFVSNPNVTIVGKPSHKLAKKLEADEEVRVKAQRERLGEDGLKQLEQKLRDAQAENDREIPEDILSGFKIPSAESVHFIQTQTARSGFAKEAGTPDNAAQRALEQDKTDLPTFLYFESGPTRFAHINLVLCTHAIPTELRPLLTVYLLNFFDTPIERNGTRVEFEDVVVALERDTVNFSIDSGGGMGNPDLLRIRLQVEPDKYGTAISWIRDALFHGIFDQERLDSAFVKILADLPEEKRQGYKMVAAVAELMHTTRDSTDRASNILVKTKWMKRMYALFKKDPAAIINKMEQIRKTLARPSNFRVFVLADLEAGGLKTPVSSWKILTNGLDMSNPTLDPLDNTRKTISEHGRNLGQLAYIIPMPTVDSSFLYARARGPDSYDHPDLPAVAVAVSYLQTTEGPLWNAVRGTGLAYGVGFSRSIVHGFIQFDVYRSPDAYKAFAASKKVIQDFASGAQPIDDIALEGAISSIIVGFADEQPTMNSAAAVSFINQVIKGIPRDWGMQFMKKARTVTKDDVKRIMSRIVLPLFEPGQTDLFVTCAPIMADKLSEAFGKQGFKPEVKPLSEFSDDYGLEAGEDEDDDDDDDEDMDDVDDDEEESEEGDELE